jgi:hypothetical protein
MQIFGTILVLLSVSANLAEMNPQWRDPSAFARHKLKKQRPLVEGSGTGESCINIVQQCEAPPNPFADTMAALLYKKFVRYIFNRKKLMVNILNIKKQYYYLYTRFSDS